MSSFDPENSPEGIDALLASIEAGVGEIDVVADFAHDFLEGGLNGLALKTPERIAQFKNMYGQMWDRVAGILLAEDADWRRQESPKSQIDSLFGSIWELKDSPEQSEVATVTFGISFCDDRTDGVWGEIFGSTSYFGKNEVLRTVESICRDGNLGTFDSPLQTATFLMNFVFVGYTYHLITEGEYMKDKAEWLEALGSKL